MLKDLHPQIKEFWENQGYTIKYKSDRYANFIQWFAYNNTKYIYIGCYLYSQMFYYLWSNADASDRLTEEQTLKLIKMKAFW